MSMKRVQQGFTLIELMIVVAIIGILAAVAIPQYKDYTIKAKIGNALSAVDSIKTGVAVCLQENGGVGNATGAACANGTGGVPLDNAFTPTKEVASITTAGTATGATIEATLGTGIGSDVDGKKITWTATSGGSAVTWSVGTTVTNTAAIAAITKNNIAAPAPAGP